MGRKSRWLAGARGFRRPRRLRPEALPFTKALPFKGRVGWGWCFSSLVISAQAGSQLLALSCFSNCRASTRLRRAGHFLDSGHPALRRYAASFAVRAAPAAQCLCKESNQRNTPPVARSPGILPSDSARLLRGSLNVHPCTCSERARVVRALLRTFLRSLAAPQGAPFGRHPAAEAKTLSDFSTANDFSHCVVAIVRVETWRGTKSRERLLLRQDAAQMGPLWRGERVEEKPEGARAGCARGRCAHMDVRSAPPGTRSRSRRAGCPETALLGVCFFW